jgi:hypothetical protein
VTEAFAMTYDDTTFGRRAARKLALDGSVQFFSHFDFG